MRIKQAIIGAASVLALGVSAIAAAENPEHDATWDQQLGAMQGQPAEPHRDATANDFHRGLQTKPAIHGFHMLSPDEETWDPAYEMDPHIGRHQDPNAPN